MNVRDLIIGHESLKLKPYTCTAGKLTIGVGRNLDDRGISESEAMFLFQNDLEDTLQHCKRFPWFDHLSEVRQAAIADLMFNLGPTRFAGFRNFIKAMADRDYTWAGTELEDSKWFAQVGRRSRRIKSMIQTNRWPT
jgi:lysozyme